SIAASFDVTTIVATCGSTVSAPVPLDAFRPLLTAVADHCRSAGQEESDLLLSAHGKVLAPYEPALQQVPGFASFVDPGPLAPNEARQRVLDAITELIFAFANRRPLVLVIDDLQWGDD